MFGRATITLGIGPHSSCISEVNYYAGFLTEIFESVYYTDIILLDDFNFKLHNLSNRYAVLEHMLDRFNLTACSNKIAVFGHRKPTQ